MRAPGVVVLSAVLAGCSTSRPAPQAAKPAAVPVKITQFYATKPALARGEQELLCYGVENAKTVTLSPPRQELSAALSRCVEVKPTETTTYSLTAEGTDGQTATQAVTVTVGAPRARIVEVQVSELEVLPGDSVSLCYKVENAREVRVEPVHFRAAGKNQGCAVVNPRRTTTYSVVAVGASGDTDQEKLTVKVR